MSTRAFPRVALPATLALLAACSGSPTEQHVDVERLPDHGPSAGNRVLDLPGGTGFGSDPALPSGIQELATIGSTLASTYTGIMAAIDVATKFLQAAGVLPGADQTAAQFAALNQHLDAVAGNLSWHEDQVTRDNRRATQYTAIDTIVEAQRAMTGVSVTTPAISDSLQAVYAAELDSAFQRYYLDSNTNGRHFYLNITWKDLIADRQQPTNGFAYDWRVGVPELLQLLALRMQVIAGVDPSFRTDGVFTVELTRHRNALLAQYANMVAGVRCNTPVWTDNTPDGTLTAWHYMPTCADINTGASWNQDIAVAVGTYPVDPATCNRCNADQCWVDDACAAQRQTDYDAWYQSNVASAQDMIRRQLMAAMPLFEVRQMIDTLYLYISGQPDLTERSQRIVAAANTGLCVDVEWGRNVNGTPVWLWGCYGGDPQKWVYDRQSGTIRNPVYNRCLDVAGQGLGRGTTVDIWDCVGDPAQKWTYDPEKQVIQSALGTVLDIQNGVIAQQTPLWAWDRWDGPPQQWLAEGHVEPAWSSPVSRAGYVTNVGAALDANGNVEAIITGGEHMPWHLDEPWSGGYQPLFSSADLGRFTVTAPLAIAAEAPDPNGNRMLDVFALTSTGAIGASKQYDVNPYYTLFGPTSNFPWLQNPPYVTFSSSPGIGQRPDGALEMFATAADGSVWIDYQTTGTNGSPYASRAWSGWKYFAVPGPGSIGQPAVAQNAGGGLDVFVLGRDHQLYVRSKPTQYGTWGAWTSLGGSYVFDPVVGTNADGRLEVFLADTSYQHLCHVWQTTPGGAYAGSDCGFGGTVTNKPAVISNWDGSLNVFVRGTDGHLWHVYETLDARAWVGFTDLGGSIDGSIGPTSIATARDAQGRVQVYYRNPVNGSLMQTTQVTR
jgi:hypothetical protein